MGFEQDRRPGTESFSMGHQTPAGLLALLFADLFENYNRLKEYSPGPATWKVYSSSFLSPFYWQ